MRKDLLVVILLAIIIAFLYWGLNSNALKSLNILRSQQTEEHVTLTMWGINNDENEIQPLIDEYHQQHPNIEIKYIKQSSINYRTRLQTQLRSGQGPDLFEIHNSWVPIFTPDLAAAPSSIETQNDFNVYYPVVKQSLVYGGKVYGLPLEIDGLVLFYNPDILKGVASNPPATWQEFIDDAVKMTTFSQGGNQIQTAGAAMGVTNNIDYWSDTVGLLFAQQPQASLLHPADQNGQEVFQFYSQFINQNGKTWDSTLPSAGQMFASGRLGFYLAPLSAYSDLVSANPNLKFGVASVPQIADGNVNWGRFYVMGVAKASKNQVEAWNFLKFMTSQDSLKKLNQQRVSDHKLANPYPYTDLADEQKNDAILGPVIKGAPTFTTWFLNYNTGDAGLNDEMIQVYKPVVDAYSQSGNNNSILATAEAKVSQTLLKYGIGVSGK